MGKLFQLSMLKKEKELEKDRLKETLDNYKKLIDKKKELIDLEKDYKNIVRYIPKGYGVSL